MNINANSWHYKVYADFVGNKNMELSFNSNPSLCAYFWGVILGLLSRLIVALIVLFVIICLGFAIYQIGFLIYSYPYRSLQLLLIAIAVSILIVGIYRLSFRASDAWDNSDSLLTKYLRAKKEKVCPLVTFIYDNNSSEKDQ
jgi:hypothetical protein